MNSDKLETDRGKRLEEKDFDRAGSIISLSVCHRNELLIGLLMEIQEAGTF